MTTWLIDISNHQGAFDVGRAVSEGYSVVWMKATEGTSFRDGRFDTFAAQTIAAGALPGAYHYLRSGSGRSQCEAFYGRLVDHGGPGGWLAACDNEADAGWQTTVDFFARWRELAGDHPLFMYSGNWWWGSRGWNGASLTPYLWDSRYVSGSGLGPSLYGKVPGSWWSPRYGGWGNVTILQFSSSGVVAGRPIDVNVFRGSVDELRALARIGPKTPTTSGIDEMQSLVRWIGSNAVMLTNGINARWVTTEDEMNGLRALLGDVRVVDTKEPCGQIVGPRPIEWGHDPAEESRVAAMAARDLAQQTLDRVLAMEIGNVDVGALAIALASVLPVPVVPSAAEVADAVADEEASRLAE